MARNGQNYFLKSRPLTPGFTVREDGSSKVTDLPHFMKGLAVSGTYLDLSEEATATLRYESSRLEGMMKGNATIMAVLPMN